MVIFVCFSSVLIIAERLKDERWHKRSIWFEGRGKGGVGGGQGGQAEEERKGRQSLSTLGVLYYG